MEQLNVEEIRRRKAEQRARNGALMPALTELVAYAREALKAQGLTCKDMKLVHGVDRSTGYEIGTAGAIHIHALDLQPRRVE